MNEWATLIDNAPTGSTIDIAVHAIDSDAQGGLPLINALVAAQQASPPRFEHVRLLTTRDENVAANPRIQDLALLPDVSIRNCQNDSCLPGYQPPAGSNHAKLVLLGQNGGNTIYSIGSQNFTDGGAGHGGGSNRFNDTMIFTEPGSSPVVTKLHHYFDRMFSSSWNGWDTLEQKTETSGAVKVYAGPRTYGTSSVQRLWFNILDSVASSPDACDPDGNGVGGYVVLMNLDVWESAADGAYYYDVFDKLHELQSMGCRVRVLTDADNAAANPGRAAEDAEAAYTNVTHAHPPPTTHTFNLGNGRVAYLDELHTKMLILKDVRYAGSVTDSVFTGSFNMRENNLLHNADLMVRVRDEDVADKYFEYAKHLWSMSLDREVAGSCGGMSCLDQAHGVEQAAGSLRVTTSPAVPSMITVNGLERDQWGLDWLELPVGSYEVCFGDVLTHISPPCETVQVNEGATTEVVGTFTEKGQLSVRAYQTGTTTAVGAYISVDGVEVQSHGLDVDLPPGSYDICFGPVAGFNPPACQNGVLVSSGTLTAIEGYFDANGAAQGPPTSGMLHATTSPAIGATISLDGQNLRQWSINWARLPASSYDVCFLDHPGYTTPPCQTVNVGTSGTPPTVVGGYIERGYLQVTTVPATNVTITIDAVPRDNWGIYTSVEPGTYNVCARFPNGPACQTVSVVAAATTQLNLSAP